MCGIAAVCGLDPDSAVRAVEAMCEQMLARGPDDGGVELVGRENFPVCLGNRRLAIIDPSPAGHQPMADTARGTTITFNGMVYNFRELRERLAADGERFTSDCDTEVVLKAYGRYGPDCVHHLRGMFAFAIWDELRNQLFIARDRLGIKPLYYSHDDARLLCASQVKALLATGLVPPRLSPTGIETYLSYGAVSEPWTAIDDVWALPAGHRAVFRDGELLVECYWEPPARPTRALASEGAASELRELLEDSVRHHVVSDAPLGVFLSGGLDSSILAALAARHTSRLRTVSVVFDDPELSESRYSALVAAHLGSEHVPLTLGPEELRAWLDDAFEAMDQPTFDGINTYVVARAARETGLKVALSGLGADELFDGYGYVRRVSALERARFLPTPLAPLAARFAGYAGRDSRGEKLAAWIAGGAEPGMSYDLLRRLFPADGVRGLLAAAAEPVRPPLLDPDGDLFNKISVLELGNYMKNVLLRDADSMTMANSIEARVPFLDDPLVAWALDVPGGTKGRAKALLAAATADLLPAEIHSRGKHGFLLPLRGWIGNELRTQVKTTLCSPPEAVAEILAPGAGGSVWDEYLRSSMHWLRPWSLYALCRWAESLSVPVGVGR